MPRKLTHNDYIKKLKDKNIEVYPIEEYKGSQTKIKHRCICNNIWEVVPNSVIKGCKCGCYNISEYLQKLKDKNIEVYPIEEYKGTETKIKHKCTCGNEWMITPVGVLNNNKCGCKRSNSNDNYINLLKSKNIKVKPLEEYKTNRIKIKHKCICGKVWNVSPKSILNGQKCGCMKGTYNIETYRNRKTILYYIKVDNIYKIGLSIFESYKTPERNILKHRYGNKTYKKYNIEIVQYRIYNDGADAYMKEKEILKKYDNKRYMYINEDMNNFVGYTELFKEDLDIIL